MSEYTAHLDTRVIKVAELQKLYGEIARLRFWLDVATTKASIPEHALDAQDRAWLQLACRFSNEHLPSPGETTQFLEEYESALQAAVDQ